MNGVKPNKAMQARHDAMREIGCIICLREGIFTPAKIHHINGCKTQERHAETLGLCYCHHQADQEMPVDPRYTSRHPFKKRFEERYGTEEELLIEQNKLLEEYNGL